MDFLQHRFAYWALLLLVTCNVCASLAKAEDTPLPGTTPPQPHDKPPPPDTETSQNERHLGDQSTAPPNGEESISEVEEPDDVVLPPTPWIDEPTPPASEETQPGDGDSPKKIRGPRYLLEKIKLKGNKKTIGQVILRYIEIPPGEVFSVNDPRLEKARYRLLAAGLFHKVDFSLKRGSKRGWAILVVKVKERNTIVVQDIVFGFSEIPTELSPYGSLDVAERSILGTGVKVSAAAAVSKEQYSYRLRISDDHFLSSDFAIHAEGLFAHARDFFGKSKVCFHGCKQQNEDGSHNDYDEFATLKYNRGGVRLGTGYTLLGDNYFSIDYRFELIDGNVPTAGSHVSFGERRPIVYGHLLPGHSILSSLIIGVVRDTRDSFILASKGYRTAFEVEIASEMIGSDYDFSKFTLVHDMYFPLVKNHSIRVSLFTGLIMGDAPFFNQFFVGDFSAFVPSRVLELNFSHLQPNLLETTIAEMRYEDLAVSLNVEYSIPFYRGDGFFYGVNGFVGLGIFALASRQTLRMNPQGYSGYQVIPMDLTADIGVKIDTKVGLFVFSLANLFRLIPSVGDAAAEE